MRNLPEQLTKVIEAWDGEELVGHSTLDRSPLYRAFWCDECQLYQVWPGPDWGASHYFCDDCLNEMEVKGDDAAKHSG